MVELKQLKEWYNRYKDFWTEWKLRKPNYFSEKEITTIEMFRDNHFIIGSDQLEKYYTKTEIINQLEKPLVKKLELHYQEFKEWIIIKFEFFIVMNALRYGWNLYFETPIEKLPFSKSVLKNFSLFDCSTIRDIMDQYGEAKFNTDQIFAPFRKFYAKQNTTEQGWDYFFDIPVETLPIEQSAIVNVKSLGCSTFDAILCKYGKSGFFDDNVFPHILKFKDLMKQNIPLNGKLIKRQNNALQV